MLRVGRWEKASSGVDVGVVSNGRTGKCLIEAISEHKVCIAFMYDEFTAFVYFM